MRVYSPSQTSLWLTCPLKRRLAQQWVPRQMTRRDLAALVGTAVAAGVGAYHTTRSQHNGGWRPTPDQKRDYSQIAETVCRSVQDEALSLGRELPLEMGPEWEALPKMAARATELYVTHDPIPPEWSILAVEETYPEHGSCRLDLVVHDGLTPAPVDLKVKLRLDTRYRQAEIDRYAQSWQMLHYVWVVQQVYQQLPAAYHIAFCVLSPTPQVWLESYPVSPETLALWASSAERIWEQMAREDRGEADPWMAAEHREVWGPCEYLGACFDFHLDPSLMSQYYIPRHTPQEEEAQ